MASKRRPSSGTSFVTSNIGSGKHRVEKITERETLRSSYQGNIRRGIRNGAN